MVEREGGLASGLAAGLGAESALALSLASDPESLIASASNLGADKMFWSRSGGCGEPGEKGGGKAAVWLKNRAAAEAIGWKINNDVIIICFI